MNKILGFEEGLHAHMANSYGELMSKIVVTRRKLTADRFTCSSLGKKDWELRELRTRGPISTSFFCRRWAAAHARDPRLTQSLQPRIFRYTQSGSIHRPVTLRNVASSPTFS